MGNPATEGNFNRIENIVENYGSAANNVMLTEQDVRAFIDDAKKNTDLNLAQKMGFNANKVHEVVQDIMGGEDKVSLKTLVDKADRVLEEEKGIEIGISSRLMDDLLVQLEEQGAVVDENAKFVSLEGKDVADRALTDGQVELVAVQMTDDPAQQQDIIDLAGKFQEIRAANQAHPNADESQDQSAASESITPMDLAKAGAATLGMEYDGQSLGIDAYKQVAYFEMADQVKEKELDQDAAQQLASQVIEARADRAGLQGEARESAVAEAETAATELITSDALDFDDGVTTEAFLTALNQKMPDSLPGNLESDQYDISVDVGTVLESVVQDAERMSIVLSGEQAKADAIKAAIDALQVDGELTGISHSIIESKVAAQFADIPGDERTGRESIIKEPTVGEVFDKVQEVASDPTKLVVSAATAEQLVDELATQAGISDALRSELQVIKDGLANDPRITVDELTNKINTQVEEYNQDKNEEEQLDKVKWAAEGVEIEQNLSASYAQKLDQWAEENDAEKKKADLASIATAVGEIFGIDEKLIKTLIALAENLLGDEFLDILNFGNDRADPDRVPPNPDALYVKELTELRKDVKSLAETKDEKLEKWDLDRSNLNELGDKIAELDLALRSGNVDQAADISSELQTNLDNYLPDAAAEQKGRIENLKEGLEERLSFVQDVTAERGAEMSLVQAAAAEQVERDLGDKFERYITKIQGRIPSADGEEQEQYIEALNTVHQLNELSAIEVAAAEQLLKDIAKGNKVEENLRTLQLMVNDDVKTRVQEVELVADGASTEAVQLSLQKGEDRVVMNVDNVTADDDGKLEQTVQVTITDANGKEEQVIFDGNNTLAEMNAFLDGYYQHGGNTQGIAADDIAVEVLSENANDQQYRNADTQFEERLDNASINIEQDNELFDVIGSMMSWVSDDTRVAETDASENKAASTEREAPTPDRSASVAP